MMPDHIWQALLPYSISDDPGVSYILIKLTLPAAGMTIGWQWPVEPDCLLTQVHIPENRFHSVG
jgi:hypothetical protein